MGITAGGIALPARVLDPASAPGRDRRLKGVEQVHVPWWDEDPLTLALDAVLALDADRLDGLRRIVLALDETHPQPGLVPHALGVDAPVHEMAGSMAGLQALDQAGPHRTLVLAGGSGLGGAGAALVFAPEEGVELEIAASGSASPLGAPGPALRHVVDALGDVGALRVPAFDPGLKAVSAEVESRGEVGEAGPAGPLVELLTPLGTVEGPVRVAASDGGRAMGFTAGKGTVPVREVPRESYPVSWEAWDRLREYKAVAWSEASQGAYVSLEEYEADVRARYGASLLGEGEVLAVTTIEAGPPGEFVRQHEAAGPYDVAIVALDSGERRIQQSALPPGALAIGDRVRGVVRRLFSLEEQWRYAVKWVHA